MKPVVLVGEAKGENEDKINSSFVGTTGALLLQMLADASVISWSSADQDFLSQYWRTRDPHSLDTIWKLHPEVYRTNVFQKHPPGNKLEWFCGTKAEGIPYFPALLKSKYVRKEFQSELDRLGEEILRLDPNLIVCLGNSAMWALSGRTGVTKLRGTTATSTHTVSGYKLLYTYHPSAVGRQWELRPTTIIDLAKINKEKEYPDVRRPRVEIWIEPDLQDIETFISRYISNSHKILSVDIETSGQQITCIGFAPRKDLAIVIPIHDERKKNGCYWPTQADERRCWELIRSVLEDKSIIKLFQNGLYDITFLARSYGIKVMGAKHDTMLLMHALQPEALKGLAYLGSVFTDHGPWKSERKMETIKAGS
jgi:uracil-DNA glycosylase